jgi:hypothetical protein
MNSLKKIACVMLCVATPLLAVGGQSGAPERRPAPQQAELTVGKRQALDPSVQRILLVLSQVLDTEKSFADGNLRIAIQVQAADMLWPYDEPRARRLFEEALEALAAANLAERSVATSSPHSRAGTLSLPLDCIRTVIRRDPALAAKMGDILVDLPADSAQPPHGINGDLRYLLAVFLSPEAPQHAVRVARPFAERGELTKLIPFLWGLRRRDAKAADELFFQGFEKARLGEFSVEDIRLLASYVLPGFGEGAISFTSGGVDKDNHKAIPFDPAVVEEFLDLAYNTLPGRLEESLASAEGNRSFFRFPREYAIARLLAPQFDRFVPDRASTYRARLEQVRRRVPPERQLSMTLYEPGTTEELLARADVLTDPGQKDLLYQKASEQVIISGDLGRASLIVDKIVSESVRSSQRQRIIDNGSDEIRKALQLGEFDKAEKMIASMSFGRIWMFQSLVGTLFQKDKSRALRLVEEEQRRAESVANGVERTQHLMTLVGVVAIIDANRAFEAMATAIEEFNRAGFVPEWDKYQDMANGGEDPNAITRIYIGLRNVSESNFQLLGSLDLDRALGIAQQLKMREASALAQLALCRGALSKLQSVTPPKPVSPPKKQEAVKTRQQQ